MSELSVNERLRRGEIVVVGNAMYQRCRGCGEIIRLNKPILGSLHFCEPEPPR